LLFSCNRNQKRENTISAINENKDIHIVNVDSIPQEEKIGYSSVFKKGKTIILETKDECLIGSINGMQVLDDELFILDNLTNSLLVFNKEGKFIRKIGSPGNGPGEYIDISDFTIDPLKKEIYLLSSSARRIYKYNIDTGNFIKSTFIGNDKVLSLNIQYHQGKLFLDAIPIAPMKNSYLLREIDPESGRQQNAFLAADTYNFGSNDPMGKSGESSFYSRSSGIPKYNQIYMDTIVSIDNGKIFPFLAVKSKHWIDSKDIDFIKKYRNENNQLYPFDYINQKDKAHYIRRYIECKNLIHFEYVQGTKMYTVLYNIIEKTARKTELFFDDLTYPKGGLLHIVACSDSNGVYAYIRTESMGHFVNLANSDQLAKDLDKRDELIKLLDDSNPVVFYYECME
jgi:hypothetical protein